MKSEVEVQLHFFAFVYTVVLISFTEKKKKAIIFYRKSPGIPVKRK